MEGRKATIFTMVMVIMVMIHWTIFLPLVTATQASLSEESQFFHDLAETDKLETQEEAEWLNKTKEALLRVSQLISPPNDKNKPEITDDEAERDACSLQEEAVPPEAIATAFEVFIRKLDPSGSVTALNNSFHQILCFEQAQAQFASEKVSVREALLQRPAVARYVKVLAERLDARQRRLRLLAYRFPRPQPPQGHLSGSLLSTTIRATEMDKILHSRISTEERHSMTEEEISQNLIDTASQLAELLSRILGMELMFAAVTTAITVAEEAHAIMTNLQQELENMQPPTSPIGSKVASYGPYCQNTRDRGTLNELTKKMLTAVLTISTQLKNADDLTDITTAREELQCRTEAASEFVLIAAKYVGEKWKNGLLNIIKKSLRALTSAKLALEARASHLPSHIQEITAQKNSLENSVQEATASYLQHHQDDTHSHNILKTKVNVFQETEIGPGCCH